MAPSKPIKEIDSGIERLLEDCELAYKSGFIPVVYEATCLCKEYDVEVPNWLLGALMEVLDRTFSFPKLSMGMSTLENELTHFLRWSTVHHLISNGVKWTNVYNQAIEKLGTENVTGYAIEKSYKKVEKKLKNSSDYRRIHFILIRTSNRILSKNGPIV
jgi:hypothetical protein